MRNGIFFRFSSAFAKTLALLPALFILFAGWGLFSPAVAGQKGGQPLRILSFLPADVEAGVERITVRFSEPMRALGVFEEEAENAPLRLDAQGLSLSGVYRWQDPATLSFVLDAPLSGPATIRACVPAGTRALSGATLPADECRSISTPPLLIECPYEGSQLPPKNASVTIHSNYPLRLDDVKSRTSLFMGKKALPISVKEYGESKDALGRTVVWYYQVSVESDLPPDARLQLVLDAGIRLENSPGTSEKYSFSLKSYPSFKLEEWRIEAEQGDENSRKKAPEAPLSLAFSNPVALKDLLEHISISPEAALPTAGGDDDEEISRRSSRISNRHYLSYRWQPRTKYTVTIRKGLADVYGGALAKDERFSFTTGDYYPFFSMDNTGIRYMERSLGGKFPIVARNVSPVTVRLRYVPWDSPEAVKELSIFPQQSSEDFLQIPGAVETTTILDFSEQANSTLLRMLDLPQMLGFSGVDDVRGHISVLVTVPRPKNRQYNDQKNDVYTAYLQITSLALTCKAGQDESLVWVTDLESGLPVEGAEVSIVSKSGESVWQGRSGPDGVARLPGKEKKSDNNVLLMARHGGETVFGYEDSGRIHSGYGSVSGLWAAHMLTQLPLYMPGQEVRFVLYTGHVTQKDGEKRLEPENWRPMYNEKLSINVQDSHGREIWSGTATSNAYGSVSGSFPLAESAPSGQYRVQVAAESMTGQVSSYPFQVASFRPPDFKVDLVLPEDQPSPDGNAPLEGLRPGMDAEAAIAASGREAAANATSLAAPGKSSLSGEVRAAYFSGASLPGAQVSLAVTGTNSFFSPERLQRYRVGLGSVYSFRGAYFDDIMWHDAAYERRSSLAEFSGKLDEEGRMPFDLPRLPIAPGVPKNIQVEATVSDASGLVTQGAGSFTLHPSSAYVGIRAPYVAAREEDVPVGLKAATWKNEELLGVDVRLVAQRVTGQRDEMELAWEKTCALSRPEGDTVQVRFERGGEYILTAIIKDEQGLENRSSTRVYVSGSDFAHFGGKGQALELLPDNTEYAPGQTARIIVKNPFERAQALITTERSGVRKVWVRELAGQAPIIDIPITEQDAPYVFVSVALVRGRTAPPPDAADSKGPSPDEGAPAMASATIALTVAGNEPGLSVSVTTDAREYRPGAQARAEVRVAGSDGKPRKAQVTLLAVDDRYLRAAGENTGYNPLATFHSLQSHGVSTTDTRTMLLDLSMRIANLQAAEMPYAAAQASGFTARQRIRADMSFVSGDEDMATAGGGEAARLRSNFDPMAFWLAEGETDDKGRLQADFTLPDTLTSYRIVAVAADTASRFAVAEESIKVNSPLQVLSALPRFVTGGDELELRFLVQNTGTEAGTVTVLASAQGMELQKTKANIALEPGKSGLVGFPAKVLLPGDSTRDIPGSSGAGGQKQATASVTVTAVMGKERDGAVFSLPVMPPQPLLAVAAAGMVKQDQEFTLPVQLVAGPSGTLDPRSRLDVVLAASPAAGLSLTADSVLAYPWGCLEQRLSRAWVRGIRMMHGELLGLESDPKDREILKAVMDSIPAFQRYNGGFALWEGAADADIYLTAYALLVDARLRSLNVPLDRQSREDALRYLSQSLGRSVTQKDGKEAENSYGYIQDTEAIVLWALSEHGAESALTLFPKVLGRMEKSRTGSPLGYGALLLAARNMPDFKDKQKHTAAILKHLEAYKAITATEMHFAPKDGRYHWFTMGSSLRDNALLLAALSGMQDEYPHLEALALWVSRGLADRGSYLSTQEGIFGLWGLAEYLTRLEGNTGTEVRATWNGKESVTHSFTRLVDPARTWTLPADILEKSLQGAPSPAQFALRLEALKGNPHWTARLTYAVPSLPLKAENAGFAVERTWTLPKAEPAPGTPPVMPLDWGRSGTQGAPGGSPANAGSPATGGSAVQTPFAWRVGDVVEVSLSIRVDDTRRHALVFDPFPAGFEPIHATRVDLANEHRNYQYPWQWEDVRNDGVLLYTRHLSPGVHTYTYRLRAATPGVFVHRATHAEEMYAPEVFGRTGVSGVEVGE